MAGRVKTEVLGSRGRALEEAFFAHHERKMIERARQAAEERSTREALAAASGIQDGAVLDTLSGLGLHAETVAALALVPLVEVAWADHAVHAEEHAAVLRAAEKSGVAPGSPARQLLDEWLDERPSPALLEAWKSYVVALDEVLDSATRTALRDDLLRRARHVAEAAGGFLGMKKISAAERKMLDLLEQAFSV